MSDFSRPNSQFSIPVLTEVIEEGVAPRVDSLNTPPQSNSPSELLNNIEPLDLPMTSAIDIPETTGVSAISELMGPEQRALIMRNFHEEWPGIIAQCCQVAIHEQMQLQMQWLTQSITQEITESLEKKMQHWLEMQLERLPPM